MLAGAPIDGYDDADFDFALQASIDRATDLHGYDPALLTAAHDWIVRLDNGVSANDVAAAAGAESQGATGYISRTYQFEFPANVAGDQAAAALHAATGVDFFYPLIARDRKARFVPNDPLYKDQWHLNNTGQIGGMTGADADVEGAWDTVLGNGVVIGIVDDGLQYTHPDLSAQYRSDLSIDVLDGDSDPAPDPDQDWHGTAVAGVAAAAGNNQVGVSGVAPNAQLAGIRLIGFGNVNDQQEADALGHLPNDIDIYNNSWGPPDAFSYYKGPEPLALAALKAGYENGRDGLGNIFTWAGGNGLEFQDNSNYDGYANSRYTFGIAAIGPDDKQAYYSESGANLLVAAHSNDDPDVGIVTTDITGPQGYAPHPGYTERDYTNDFGGTSSATPLVSGVVALMLEANPDLTVRDVQQILAKSARKNDPTDADWRNNGAGLHVNHKYGFGAVDAAAAVDMATTWKKLPPAIEAQSGLVSINTQIPDNNANGLTATFTVDFDLVIERIEVKMNIDHLARGDLEIILTTPSGTQSRLAEPYFDLYDILFGTGINDWVYSTMRHLGESSLGTWSLKVADRTAQDVGTWENVEINVIGTLPVFAVDDEANTPPGVPVVIDVLDNDVSLRSAIVNNSVTITQQPAAGTVTVNPTTGAVTYTPNASFSGTDSFTYTFRNQAGQTSNQALVTITVNNPPNAVNDSLTTAEETPGTINILANDTDSDGTIIASTVKITDPPNGGFARVDPTTGVVTYTPRPNFSGTDTFQYTVEDDDGAESTPATVTVTVTPVNDPTVANNDTATTPEDTPLLIDVLANDVDPDGTPARVTIVSPPLYGTAAFDTATKKVLYTPAPNYFGPDSFTYTASDAGSGAVPSNVATVTITVTPLPDPPLAVDDEATIDEDTSASINVLANDSDPDGRVVASTLTIVAQPQHGTLELTPGSGVVIYRPAANYFGDDSYQYTVRDNSNLLSNVATVSITINPVSDPPIVATDFANTDQGPAIIDVLANDRDPDMGGSIDRATLAIVQQPAHGTITLNTDQTITYVPQFGYVGGDGFLYTVKDNEGSVSQPGTVVVRHGAPVSASGFVYADLNNNGVKDPSEVGISDVGVSLVKTDGFTFSYTVRTAADGSFHFQDGAAASLPAGVYNIVQIHPVTFFDGRETAGTPAPLTTVNDAFQGITLAAGQSAEQFYFGELGLRPEFVGTVLSRRAFFASAAPDEEILSGLNLAAGDVWIAYDAGWQGDLKAQVRFLRSEGSVNLALYDASLRKLAEATTSADAAQLRWRGQTGTPVLLKVSGSNTSTTLLTQVGGDVAQAVRTTWQNVTRPMDVDNDGEIAPLDALIIINALDANGAGSLSGMHSIAGTSFPDTDGDGQLAPLDALLIINRLGTHGPALAPLAEAAPGDLADAALLQLADDPGGMGDELLDALAPAGQRRARRP